ncbi:hypothetical protein [Halovivax limisalsi]|uniref:hypothetical protein n=1 Tax=Halovivax limisalsi TaxID=1453760 RepID=UPI001FFD88EB|nr:hypothetical protein [Halovivax limisalsi]
MATERLSLVVEFRVDIRFEPLERSLITAEEFAVYGIVCNSERKRLEVRHVDERERLALQIAGEDTSLLEALSLG